MNCSRPGITRDLSTCPACHARMDGKRSHHPVRQPPVPAGCRTRPMMSQTCIGCAETAAAAPQYPSRRCVPAPGQAAHRSDGSRPGNPRFGAPAGQAVVLHRSVAYPMPRQWRMNANRSRCPAAVLAITVRPARREWQQARFFAIAQVVDLDGGTFCQFTDSHAVFLHCPGLTSIDLGVTPGFQIKGDKICKR